MSNRGSKVEVDFSSVLAPHRSRGLGTSMVAYGILASVNLGHRSFATGGAEVNTASKALVVSLGFELDEVWHSYQKP